MYSAQDVIAILVERLGGDVTIPVYELEAADLQLEAFTDDRSFAYRLRTQKRIEAGAEPSPLALEGADNG